MARVGIAVRTRIVVGLISTTIVFTTLAFGKTNKTTVIYPSGFALSDRAADMPIETGIGATAEIHEPGRRPLGSRAAEGPALQEDPALQKEPQPLVAASQGVSFNGIPSPGFVPSDSNLAVGPNHVVEVVNIQFAVYSKTGAILAGPTNISNLFTKLSTCSSTYGDPVVLYDRHADRWVISYIGAPSQSTASECYAVSQTNDPTGAYYVYGYSFGTNLNDYPKLSTWATATNSAYLSTYNIFQNFSHFIGVDICGADRTKMLVGDPTAAQLCQMTPITEFSYLPGDMDGPTPPVDGTPGLFINWQTENPGALYLRKLTMNFASGTATLSAATAINVASFTPACGGLTCIPQPGTTRTLDSLADRVMYRFAIRHFADHDRAVLNHSVTSGSTVGVRWYEIYDPAGNATLNQQGTFSPDSTYRWMGSIAEDQLGDIGLGYSASSSTIYPAILFTGRVPGDAPGTMETEAAIIQGTGSQTGSTRWGDYTAMQVDPSDDCTFWYVDQYQTVNGTGDWSTNVSSFAFNACSGGPSFSLSANPNALTIQQGSQGTSVITVTDSGGFNGSVTLSASGMPSGVTAGFSPNPTSSTSTLTLTVPSGTATGTSTVTITGVSGALTQQTTLQLTVTQPASQPVVTLSPTSLTFAKIAVGKTSASKAVTMSNTGSATLNIASIVPSGDFAISLNTCTSTLAVGKSCKFKVSFTPTQVGARSGAITITDNAANSPQSVPLTGTGGVQAALTPANANFAKTAVGGTSVAKTFTLANKQSVALTGISPSTTGDFAISATTCGSSLGASSSCTISVVFKPTQTGVRTGTLQVSDSALGSPQASNLAGTGK